MKNNQKIGYLNKWIKLVIDNIINFIVLNKNWFKEIMKNLYKKERGLFIIGWNCKKWIMKIKSYVKMNF